VQLYGDRLYSSVRILCLVLSRTTDIKRHAAITDTWGKRCNRLIIVVANANKTQIVYEKNDTSEKIGKLVLNLTDDYSTTWLKVRETLIYVHKNIDMR